jgi:hypothetical protein
MSRTLERRRRWQPPRFIDEEIDEDRLRQMLVSQHDRLRAMLTSLDRQAVEVIRGGTCSPRELGRRFAGIASALDDHTRGEERALTRLLPRTAAAARALERLREDHLGQRDELRAMSRLATRCDDGITLALAIRALVSDALLEMETEDRRYLSGGPLEGEAADAGG